MIRMCFVAGLALAGCGGGDGSLSFRPFDTSGLTEAAGVATPDMSRPFRTDMRVVMLGDSITAGGAWAEWLAGSDITNHGISGDATVHILERMDAVLADAPEVTYVMAGINDVYGDYDAEEIMARYVEIIDRLRGAGSAVVIQSTLECTATECGAARLDTVRRLNGMLREHALREGIDYIDLNAALSDRGGLKPELTHDGIHINATAYAAWTELLVAHMERVGLR